MTCVCTALHEWTYNSHQASPALLTLLIASPRFLLFLEREAPNAREAATSPKLVRGGERKNCPISATSHSGRNQKPHTFCPANLRIHTSTSSTHGISKRDTLNREKLHRSFFICTLTSLQQGFKAFFFLFFFQGKFFILFPLTNHQKDQSLQPLPQHLHKH